MNFLKHRKFIFTYVKHKKIIFIIKIIMTNYEIYKKIRGSVSYREMSGSKNLFTDLNKNGNPIKKGS